MYDPEGKEKAKDDKTIADKTADGILKVGLKMSAGEHAAAQDSPQKTLADQDERQDHEELYDAVEVKWLSPRSSSG